MTERWELLELIGQTALRDSDTNLPISTAEAILDAVEPIIRADALSRFSITEFPNGKIQTLIADGTHWVTVSTANSMVDRARADERERAYCKDVDADNGKDEDIAYLEGALSDSRHWAKETVLALADLRAKVEGLPTTTVPLADADGDWVDVFKVVSLCDVLALLSESSVNEEVQ